jgi:hypothetical protein
VARDRTGQTLAFVTGKGALTKAQLQACLPPVIDKDVLLVTDGHAAYRAFAREAGISHEAVNLRAGIRVRGGAHVQNVNAYHSRLRGWLSIFHGVASRYLPNYLGWRWILDAGRIRSPETLLKATLGGVPTPDGDIAFRNAHGYATGYTHAGSAAHGQIQMILIYNSGYAVDGGLAPARRGRWRRAQ